MRGADRGAVARPRRRTGLPAVAPAALATGLVALLAGGATAQSTLDRSPLLDGGAIGLPWDLDANFGSIMSRDAAVRGIAADPWVDLRLGLPRGLALLVRYAPAASLADRPDHLEAAARRLLLDGDADGPIDLAVEVGGEVRDRILTAGVAAGHRAGPLRLLATARALGTTFDDIRLAAGAGAVWHPAPGRLPIAVVADASSFVDREGGERIAWRAGLQAGVSFTAHTLSIHATNADPTLIGRLSGRDRVRLAVELTTHVPLGRFLGRHVPREDARAAVREAADAPAVVVPIREYRYAPARIVIEAGTAVEWVNEDAAVHTASADDGSWSSGGLQQGERWRAVFDRPGTYPYHCGPHPFMRGVVIVRPA